MKRLITTLLAIFLLLTIIAGAIVFFRPKISRVRRENVQKEMMEQIKSGKTDIVITSVPAIEGVEDEFTEIAAEQPSYHPSIEVTGYGIIEIPVIELAMPLVKGTDAASLTAAAGWYTESAEVGTAGNAVILGHRMYGYGEQFNRLGELKLEDTVYITLSTGNTYSYTVTGTEVIDPSSLMEKLAEHNEGFCLTLVTCTPIGDISQRLLVYAKLTN